MPGRATGTSSRGVLPVWRITGFRRRPITCLGASLSPSDRTVKENGMTLDNEQIVRQACKIAEAASYLRSALTS